MSNVPDFTKNDARDFEAYLEGYQEPEEREDEEAILEDQELRNMGKGWKRTKFPSGNTE